MILPEQYRATYPVPYIDAWQDATCGWFKIPYPDGEPITFYCWAVDDTWEHVTVVVKANDEAYSDRTPTWAEMCFIKGIFWEPEDAVMQLHPPASQYINLHPFCLHLWRPKDGAIPLPPSILVGV